MRWRSCGQSLIAASLVQGPTQELALVGDRASGEMQDVLRTMRRRFWPDKLVALRPSATRSSALDPLCRAHDLDNLYVVDASFFPSSGAVNPALTIMANALRVGDHLRARLG